MEPMGIEHASFMVGVLSTHTPTMSTTDWDVLGKIRKSQFNHNLIYCRLAGVFLKCNQAPYGLLGFHVAKGSCTNVPRQKPQLEYFASSALHQDVPSSVSSNLLPTV